MRHKIILALFVILFVFAIVAGIAHEAGVQEGIRIASTPGFFDQVANVPLGSIIKLVILLIGIGYCLWVAPTMCRIVSKVPDPVSAK